MCVSRSTDLPAVLADRAQVQQIVMNFVLNAGEAIGDADGVIQVRTCVRDLDGVEASRLEPAFERTGGRYVGFEVRDDGAGMDAETRAHIFDPFFTTKSHGRGLGLAAGLGITRRHGGGIEVETSEHQGSTFRLLLPAAGSVGSRETPAVETPLDAGGVALVVDDEAALRRLARHSLEGFGFEVIEACDGVEAL